MTKQSGLGDNFYLDGYDLSGDVCSLSGVSTPVAVLPQTGIDKSAMERCHSTKDGAMTVKTWFNTAAGQQHPVMRNPAATDRHAMYCRGTSIGSPAACLVAKQTKYDFERGEDGSLVFETEVLANAYGLEWGHLLTAGKRTDTGATSGSSNDFAGSTAFGLQAYLHVFSFSGTDVTIRIQESSDNGSGDPFANVTGGAFTQVTAGPTKERIATAAGLTVERYLRVITATTGGFSSLVFAVAVVKNKVSTVF